MKNICTKPMKVNNRMYINSLLVAGTVFSNDNLPQVEVEFPYYDNFMFRQTRDTTYTDKARAIWTLAGPAIATTNIPYMFKSAGDDFSFHFLVAPPPGTYAPTNGALSSKPGVLGFSNWLGTLA